MKIRLIRESEYAGERQDEVIEYSGQVGKRIVIPWARPGEAERLKEPPSEPLRHTLSEYDFQRRDENDIPVYVWVGYL